MPRCLRTLFASGLVVAGLVFDRGALAQSADELAAGRQLFAEALDDEEHHRFAEALEKYRRVLRIRDTAAIRYRMGSTLEGLGKIAQAVDAYTAAVRIGAGSSDAELVRASQARIDALGPKLAHLALRLPPGTSSDAQVRVDDEPVSPEALADVRVDPGAHVVTATATGARPFRAQITLSEGGRAEIPITLELVPPAEPAPAPSSGAPVRTIGIVTGAAGAVLVAGGVVVLAFRSSAIAELNESCPNGNCPASRERELRDTRDRAVVEGPVGGALIAVGAAAVATGIVLFTIGGHDKKTSARFVPSPTSHGAIFTFAKGF
ncbi:MAG: hypothetical protein K0S65_4879 [Labilithrix sp.]|nr:hypothetical protein [Labilithrix sp.]